MPEARRLRVGEIRLLMFLAVIGRASSTQMSINDAGGIYTLLRCGSAVRLSAALVHDSHDRGAGSGAEMSARMGGLPQGPSAT